MSHEVESMFYTKRSERDVPWHGLGTPVPYAPTSAEALKLAGLDWRVITQDVTVNGIVVPGYKANVRNSDNSVLGIVSDRYKIVQNAEAFDFTDGLLSSEVHYETAGSLKNGKVIWLLAQLPSGTILGDRVDNYICFTNTHDGTGAVKVCLTPVRTVCNNTLNLALSSAKRIWSTKHMGNIKSKLEEAKYTLELADMYIDKLAIEADRLAAIRVTDDQVKAWCDELFPVDEEDSDRKKKNAKEMIDNFYCCYFAPDISKFMNTAWGVVQAASDFATHTVPTKVTTNYKENNFARVLNGHPVIDYFYDKVKTL